MWLVILNNIETLRAWHIAMSFIVMFLSGFPLYFFELVIKDVTDVHIPEQLFTVMFSTGCVLCAVLYLMKKYPLNFKLIREKITTIIVWGGLGGITIAFIQFPYAIIFESKKPESAFLIPIEEGVGYIAILMIFAVIVQPILEEVFSRLYFFRFLKSRFSTSIGYIGTSLFFSIMHTASFSQLILLFICSIILTYLYEKTGLIETSILAHMIWNAVWFSSVYGYLMFIQ